MLSLEEKRAKDAARKRKSRAAAPAELRLPMPAGTAEALARIVERAGFDDPRDFLAYQIHRLDALDSHNFEQQTKRTVTVGDLSHYHQRLYAEGEKQDVQDD